MILILSIVTIYVNTSDAQLISEIDSWFLVADFGEIAKCHFYLFKKSRQNLAGVVEIYYKIG